jgi:hypothetical protein
MTMSRRVRRTRTLSGVVALLIAGSQARAAEREYAIGKFSDEFRATLTLEEKDDVFRPGAVSVFDRKSGRRLIHVTADELILDLKDGEATANVKELPYGLQSVLIYEDFDFDGRPDLAIMDGQKSCYHGPSFRIFLRRDAGFTKSAPFTRLAHEYCGMFAVDAAAKQISVMTKSGCCWHLFQTYAVANGAPRLLDSVVESYEAQTYLMRETTGRRTATEYFLLEPSESSATVLLAFDIAGPRPKRVEVFSFGGELDYALVTGNERRVEFSYWVHVLRGRNDGKAHPFRWDAGARELGFQNGAYRYVIHDGAKAGVSVHSHGRVVDFDAVEGSRTGTLGDLAKAGLENVTPAP